MKTSTATPDDDELKHTKITIPELQPDGTIKYVTRSYYEQLAHEAVRMEKHIPTSRKDLLKDLISCLDSDLQIDLSVKFKHKEPVVIIKQWFVSKEAFNRK